MRSLLLVLGAASVLLTACSGVPSHQNDGGWTRFSCTNGLTKLSITVVDASSQPVSGANVTATNLGSGAVVALTTNGSGVAVLTEDIGPGTVQLKADANGKTSSLGQSEWTCAECDCAVNPSRLTLTVP